MKSNEGFFVILCCAHRAGAIKRKNGGNNGRVYFSIFKFRPNIKFLILESDIPYISLNYLGSVLKAVNAINGQIGLICLGTGPPPIIFLTSSATSVETR